MAAAHRLLQCLHNLHMHSSAANDNVSSFFDELLTIFSADVQLICLIQFPAILSIAAANIDSFATLQHRFVHCCLMNFV